MTVFLTKKSTNELSYLLLNIGLVLIMPMVSTYTEHYVDEVTVSWTSLVKWFIFWTIGIRMFATGIKQASSPEATEPKVLSIKNSDTYNMIRKLGFANITIGVMGILSVLHDQWRLLAAITGGLYLGLASVQHYFKKSYTPKQVIALIYDLLVFFVLFLYIAFQ